ncbi:ABC-type branched-subunit amino acid transport system substrate-binding protein [Streptomyces sp. TLI_235]|nr:bifunctional serine/threonine-protein kinase/ABC transporter substrate-binding protein [Streptomyces sp. TLI_235]PBC75360.1 ABC-type branched-subunit amino acid transport system substrate-binding protein [Streptomyces sp. TLI_235]
MTQDDAELIAGRYELIERIGQGGMGRVWRGTDRHLFGREVAVKEILFPPGLEDNERAMLLRRFTGEARAAVILNHPGIITIHDVVEHNGSPAIVMEFVRGRSLAAEIRELGRLPVRRVAEIGAAMLGALAEAHGAGIVHRDIKPDNVLLTKDRVVLTDFGIAHLADATTKLSHSGTVIGTPHYMPPEQLEGKRPTAANDLWALGATLYHAVEGRTPFEAEGLHALAIAIFTQPHRPPVVAGPLGPVLEALLAKDPAERATVARAEELLAAVLRGGDTTAAAGPVPDPAPPVRRTPTAPESVPGPADRQLPPPSHEVPAAESVEEVPEEPADGPAGESAAGPAVPAPAPPSTPPAVPPHPPQGRPVPDNPYATPPAAELPRQATDGGPADGMPTETPEAYRFEESPAGRPVRRSAGRKATVLAVALATLAVGGILAWTLTRDSGRGSGGNSADGGRSSNDSATTTVVIGVDAPLTGSLASFGAGIRNSADLAVRTANRRTYVPGVTFELKALDDQAQPQTGQQNADAFVADSRVLGVVGPLNSSVAQSMLPTLSTAGLVDVSPANTNPVLTLGSDWLKGVKARPCSVYYRTTTTDALQGPFAARYLVKVAKKTKFFVIDDKKTYGAGLADGFTGEVAALGGTVVGSEHVDPGGHDYGTLAAKIRASGAEAVYYGGEYPDAAPLSQQLKEGGETVPLMGGDGIFDTEYTRLNTRAEGDLATSVGAPTTELSGGNAFLADYRAAGFPEEAGQYGAYAYDAAWAVIEAVKSAVEANGGTLPSDARSKVVGAMAGVSFDGMTGPVAFDDYGDTKNRQLTVYTVQGGAWHSVKTDTYLP